MTHSSLESSASSNWSSAPSESECHEGDDPFHLLNQKQKTLYNGKNKKLLGLEGFIIHQ